MDYIFTLIQRNQYYQHLITLFASAELKYGLQVNSKNVGTFLGIKLGTFLNRPRESLFEKFIKVSQDCWSVNYVGDSDYVLRGHCVRAIAKYMLHTCLLLEWEYNRNPNCPHHRGVRCGIVGFLKTESSLYFICNTCRDGISKFTIPHLKATG